MQKKQEISKPELIAYTKGLTIIPFENVKCASGDIINGKTKLFVFLDFKENEIILIDDEADLFLEQYNTYLAFIEAATISDLAAQDAINFRANTGGR